LPPFRCQDAPLDALISSMSSGSDSWNLPILPEPGAHEPRQRMGCTWLHKFLGATNMYKLTDFLGQHVDTTL
jgi:hypothetical protein